MNEEPVLRTLDKLQMLGFRRATLKKFEEINDELNIEQAIRKLAKAFVNGKCRHFDETDIYFITGRQIRVNRLLQINLFLYRSCQMRAEII